MVFGSVWLSLAATETTKVVGLPQVLPSRDEGAPPDDQRLNQQHAVPGCRVYPRGECDIAVSVVIGTGHCAALQRRPGVARNIFQREQRLHRVNRVGLGDGRVFVQLSMGGGQERNEATREREENETIPPPAPPAHGAPQEKEKENREIAQHPSRTSGA